MMILRNGSSFLSPEVWEAFCALTVKHMPLILPHDKVYASPEAAKQLWSGYGDDGVNLWRVVEEDKNLSGLEMRLVKRLRSFRREAFNPLPEGLE